MSKSRLYLLSALFAVVAGCSKEEPQEPEAPAAEPVPASFTEAREKGMVDAKWKAELEKARKENASPVVAINDELAAVRAKLGEAKASKAAPADIEALEKKVKDLEKKAAAAEKAYRRKMMQMVHLKMMKEFEAADAAGKADKKAK